MSERAATHMCELVLLRAREPTQCGSGGGCGVLGRGGASGHLSPRACK